MKKFTFTSFLPLFKKKYCNSYKNQSDKNNKMIMSKIEISFFITKLIYKCDSLIYQQLCEINKFAKPQIT